MMPAWSLVSEPPILRVFIWARDITGETSRRPANRAIGAENFTKYDLNKTKFEFNGTKVYNK
jgi:hypothetical protein